MASSMTATRLFIPLFFVLFFLCACDRKKEAQLEETLPAAEQPSKSPQKKEQKAPDDVHYQEIEWPDLMPKEDLDALMNPPEYLDDIADGSEEDALPEQFSTGAENPDDPYQKALVSTRVIPEFNNRKIRLPGFIVPLDFDDHQVITTFLLVPFFGACIHLPPPPPNQIIFATYEPGLSLDDLSDAFFVEGTIFTELKEGDLATSAYSMTIDRILPYEEDQED
jgi:hypothetical protein